MKVLMWVIIILLIVVALFIFIAVIAIYGIAASLAANTQKQNNPNRTIQSLENMLGLNFEDDFEVTEFSSRPLHPDQPLKIRLKLGNELVERIRSIVTQIEPSIKEEIDKKKKIKYSTIIDHKESSFMLSRISYYHLTNLTIRHFFARNSQLI